MKCQTCKTEYLTESNFCNTCGARLHIIEEHHYANHLLKAKVFFFILLGYIGILHFLEIGGGYISSLIMDGVFALIVIVFLVMDISKLKSILKPNISNYKLVILVVLSLVALAFCVSQLADYLNQIIFNSAEKNHYELYKDAPYPLLVSIISVGVFPALFEEIAFRGILFNELKKMMSVNATIILTTILFTVLHFSFISFLWIFPIGMLFGYLRSKYDTLTYGIIGHFVYNTSIVLIDYADFL